MNLISVMQLLRKRNRTSCLSGERSTICGVLDLAFFFGFYFSSLRSVWFAFLKEVGPEMNSSQLRKAAQQPTTSSTRAERLVKLMANHTQCQELRPQPIEENEFHVSASPSPKVVGCAIQICHAILVNSGKTLETRGLFSREYFFFTCLKIDFWRWIMYCPR